MFRRLPRFSGQFVGLVNERFGGTRRTFWLPVSAGIAHRPPPVGVELDHRGRGCVESLLETFKGSWSSRCTRKRVDGIPRGSGPAQRPDRDGDYGLSSPVTTHWS